MVHQIYTSSAVNIPGRATQVYVLDTNDVFVKES